jgi:hypothetical protein
MNRDAPNPSYWHRRRWAIAVSVTGVLMMAVLSLVAPVRGSGTLRSRLKDEA